MERRVRKKREDVDSFDLDDSIEEDMDSDFDDFDDNSDNNDDYDENEDLFQEDLDDGSFMGGSDGVVPMEKHNDLLKQLTDFEKYLKIKINGWLGLRFDPISGKYVRDPSITPIMNKNCADWCIDVLRTYTRDNNVITNISSDEFNYVMIDLSRLLWFNLGTRYDEWEIKNTGDIMTIGVEIEHSATLALAGAGDGKYSRLLRETITRHESANIMPNESQGNYKGPIPKSQKSDNPISRMIQALGKK